VDAELLFNGRQYQAWGQFSRSAVLAGNGLALIEVARERKSSGDHAGAS